MRRDILIGKSDKGLGMQIFTIRLPIEICEKERAFVTKSDGKQAFI